MTDKAGTTSHKRKYSAVAAIVRDGLKRVFEWKISTTEQPPASKRRKTVNHYAADEWEAKKEVIQRLFMVEDLTVQEVAKIMVEEYDFNASLPQYKEKLKKWGISKYTKLSHKQLLHMATQLARRSGIGKGTKFYLEANRLNSRNVERVMKRRLRQKDLEVFSLTSAMESCGISTHTSSTIGVRASTLVDFIGLTCPEPCYEEQSQDLDIFNVEIVDLPSEALSKISYQSRAITYSSRYYLNQEQGNSKTLGLYEFNTVSLLMDIALGMIDDEESMRIVQIIDHGICTAPELKLLLCFYHLTGQFCHDGDMRTCLGVRLFRSQDVLKVGVICHFDSFFGIGVPDTPMYIFPDISEIQSAVSLRRNGEIWPVEFLHLIWEMVDWHWLCCPWSSPIKSKLDDKYSTIILGGADAERLYPAVLEEDSHRGPKGLVALDPSSWVDNQHSRLDESPLGISLDDILHSALWNGEVEEESARS